ncbi:MAG: leucine-rich repeat domain-containing protein [Bacteroidales bacterium]|nr:leucine-rich repeat domain-containing protein [Bacteroidales bacterium]
MKFFNYFISSFVALLLLCGGSVSAQKVRYAYDSNDDGTIYKSLEEALANPDKVYRLKLVNKRRMDSLPEKIFQLKNLRELTVKGCKLNVLNQHISQLSKLIYLNVSCNHLVRLPQTIGDMTQLKGLVISRNKIYELPETMGKMKSLEILDAWDNPLYVLPESIAQLSESLKIFDLRQVAVREEELEKMEKLLPKTNILTTSYCDCSKGDR